MKNIVIVGSGAVAAEVTDYIADNNKVVENSERIEIRGYLDLQENIEKYWKQYQFERPVISDIHSYPIQTDDLFIVAVADLEYRWNLIRILRERNAAFMNFVHHSVILSSKTRLGTGNIIYPHCIIGPNTEIGDFNLLTSYSFISHNCRIGTNNFFATSGLSGHVKTGDHNMFGIRSVVMPRLTIGSGNTIQAGMIVDKEVGDNTTVFHRFKEKVFFVSGKDKPGQ
jgi:acetyltransferase-like isoleucine patch superfamily enzyme